MKLHIYEAMKKMSKNSVCFLIAGAIVGNGIGYTIHQHLYNEEDEVSILNISAENTTLRKNDSQNIVGISSMQNDSAISVSENKNGQTVISIEGKDMLLSNIDEVFNIDDDTILNITCENLQLSYEELKFKTIKIESVNLTVDDMGILKKNFDTKACQNIIILEQETVKTKK